ncbi:MAG: histidine phosphatase family protein [Acidobacteriota bacterium]
MKTLLLLRHAQAGQPDIHQADGERGLTPRGKAEARSAGLWLRRTGRWPEEILSSPAARALSTVKHVLAAGPFAGKMDTLPELYLGTAGDHLERLRGLPPEIGTALVVGHNPGLEDLLFLLTGRRRGLSPASLACVRLAIPAWTDLGAGGLGCLEELWHPPGTASA